MTEQPAEALPVIRIAAGLIVDDAGRVLLVRKRGTEAFMQAGGKIEPREMATDALARELSEELNLTLDPDGHEHLGQFIAQAANETGHMVEAEVFFMRVQAPVLPSAEIEEVVWVDPSDTADLPLAPLTRDHLLPIARHRFTATPRGV
ncbi:NUDIX hydrolase [Phyllobacterium salinisoli]|uniref:NUDIX hydrolase n=1 Tax=Phyllobacterium salinisoli TaxID=1899321 RepID=UPI001FE03833|nr:NUDIX domain-containing protein [Phyllobacterium salinisoli]